MRDYGKIYTSIWNSRKFQSLKSDDAKLVYFYVHTCPSTNSIGCFVLKSGYAAADLGWSKERYQSAIEALSIALLIGFEAGEPVVRIVDFLKHDPFTNKNHAAGAVKLARALPECQEKTILFRDIAKQRFVEPSLAYHSPPIALSNGCRTPEPEPVSVAAAAATAQPQPKIADDDMTDDQLLDAVMSAVGVNGGRIPTHRLPPTSTMHVGRWRRDLKLTGQQIVTAARPSRAGHEDPPNGPKALDAAMKRLAGELAEPTMSPSRSKPKPKFGQQPESRKQKIVRWNQTADKAGDSA